MDLLANDTPNSTDDEGMDRVPVEDGQETYVE